MEIRPVDPRDASWEVPQPRYRIYFHDSRGASDEYELWGVDVAEVMAWAVQRRGNRAYVIYACVPYDGLGLLRLAGSDPNES
jgi:hypothetical protein